MISSTLFESILLQEDIIDDLSINDDLTAARKNFRPSVQVSKDLRSRSSMERAKKNAKDFSIGKKTYEGDHHFSNDYSAYVRNYFVSACHFKDPKNYSTVTTAMRRIVGITRSNDSDFEYKQDKRGDGVSIHGLDDKDYSEIDVITMSELTAIYLLRAVGLAGDSGASDEDKIEVCELAAKAVYGRKIKQIGINPDVVEWIKECGYEIVETPSTAEEPFTPAIDVDYDTNFAKAIAYTAKEIKADKEARKAARELSNDRRFRRQQSEIDAERAAHDRSERRSRSVLDRYAKKYGDYGKAQNKLDALKTDYPDFFA